MDIILKHELLFDVICTILNYLLLLTLNFKRDGKNKDLRIGTCNYSQRNDPFMSYILYRITSQQIAKIYRII